MWRQLAQQQVWQRIGPGICMLMGIGALCGAFLFACYDICPPVHIPANARDLPPIVVNTPVHAPQAPSTESQFAYQRELEQHLAAKAQALLDRVFGPQKAIVCVSAESRLRTLTEQTEAYVSEGRVLFEEDVTKTKTSAVPRPSGETTGAAASGNGRQTPLAGISGPRLEDTTRLKWQVPKINRTSEQRFGQIDHLSVVLMFVEDKPPENAREQQALQVNRDEATKLVKQAVGFQEGRDTLQVTIGNSPALNSDPFASETPPQRSTSNVGLGLLASLGAFLLMLAIWLSQPEPITAQEAVTVQTAPLASKDVAELKKLAEALRPWVES